MRDDKDNDDCLNESSDEDSIGDECIGGEYIESVIPILNPVGGIDTKMVELRLADEHDFIEQMGMDLYSREVVKEMFEKGSDCTWMENDKCKQSLCMAIERDLARRADYCVILAEEVCTGEYGIDVARGVDGVITSTTCLLSKFVLTNKAKETDTPCTHYTIVKAAYNKMHKHHQRVINKINELEVGPAKQKGAPKPMEFKSPQRKSSDSKGITVEHGIGTAYPPSPTKQTDKQSLEELVGDQQGESQQTPLSNSTEFKSPARELRRVEGDFTATYSGPSDVDAGSKT